MNPALKIPRSIPVAVERAALLPGYEKFWLLQADFPAPHGTVYVRFSRPEQGDNCLEVITGSGKFLQRLMDCSAMKTTPQQLGASWLFPKERKGPLLLFRQRYPDEKEQTPMFLAFPEGFSGLCTLSRQNFAYKPVRWNGIQFSEAGDVSQPDAEDIDAPLAFRRRGWESKPDLRWPFLGRIGTFCAGARTAENSPGISRQVGQDPRAPSAERRLWRDESHEHRATWLDDRRKRGPILIARDSDQVRVQVFSDGFQKLLCAQDFNDSSTSIYATTVALLRDKHGILTISEDYSERGGEDGSPGSSHSTGYVWNGRGFQ